VKNSIYKSKHCKQRVVDLYEDFASRLPEPIEEGFVRTCFGSTHYLIMGPNDLPLLFHFHGGNFPNPHALLAIADLSKKYRIIAPDILGQPGKSDENRINTKSLDYGKWAAEFIACFSNKKKADCIGISYGAGVLMHLAASKPEMIGKAIFMVPTGFVRSNTLDNLRLFGPALLCYMINKTDKNLLSIIKPLIGDTALISALELEMFRAVFNGVKLSTSMPRPVEKNELRLFNSPCMIVTAEKDIMCPFEKVIAFAKDRLPGLKKTVTLENTPHMISSYKECMKTILQEIVTFLEDN